jgi:hypothetical protein
LLWRRWLASAWSGASHYFPCISTTRPATKDGARAALSSSRWISNYYPGQMDPEFPPLPKEQREILEPLTPQQLLLCVRVANRDRLEHLRTEHREEESPVNPVTVGNFFEAMGRRLVREIEDPRTAAAGREFRRRSMGIHEEKEEVDRRDMLLEFASVSVSMYWAHVTTGHATSRESSDDYVRELARRVSRRPFG